MTPLDIFLIVAAVAVLAVAVVLVPTLLQLKRTLQRADETMRSLEEHFVPMSKKIADGAAELEILAATCSAKLEETEMVIRTMRQAGETLLLTSQALKDSVRPVISNIGGISAGLQVFSRVLLSGRKNK